VLLVALERLRALPRLGEIARAFVRHGMHDLVRSAGFHHFVDETGGMLGWTPDPAIVSLPLPQRFALALESLGPAFVKLGQVLASRVDLLGPDWIESLDRLHDRAAPLDFAVLESQLLADLGTPVAERFASFERVASAAGSVAQVHRARLLDGTAVAVKIRRPGVSASIDADVLLLEALAAWWEEQEPSSRRYRPVALVRQLRKSLAREVDFTAEARAQQRFAESFRGSAAIVVPGVHARFTRESLLVMDWIEGIPATDMAAVDAAGMDREILAERGADAVLKMVLVDGFFHADPHVGNVFFLPGNRVAMIDFGMVGWLSGKRREELVDFLAALAARDPEAMRDVLIAWADGERVSAERFAEDLGRMLHLYEHATLREINLGSLLGEIAGVMREHHLLMPVDLALLFKTLISLEGLGTRLLPRFRLVDYVTPWIRRLMQERWQPRHAAARLSGLSRQTGRALRAFPRLLETIARRLGDEDLSIRLEMRELDGFSRHLERSVNRLTIGIVTAALIVGSSILMAMSNGQHGFATWFFGAVGVAIAFVNSVWLIVAIRRSRRLP
jgi:ubiquinone biosynthesis protein